jgi:hypothetical protein
MISDLTDDILIPKDEVLVDTEEEVLEDYEGEAPYGETKEEVINSLLSKYFAIGEEFDGEDVTVSQEAIRTALSDAFAAGADNSVSKDVEPAITSEITESVDRIVRETSSGEVMYELDSETGVITVNVKLHDVTGQLDIVSDAIYNKMQDILTNSSYTSEVAIEKLNVMRSKISNVLQYFVDSESFKKHVDEQTSAVLRAYAVSLEEMINKEISDENI